MGLGTHPAIPRAVTLALLLAGNAAACERAGALAAAVRSLDVELATALLARQPDCARSRTATAPPVPLLHLAITTRADREDDAANTRIVAALLAHGADPNARNARGEPAITANGQRFTAGMQAIVMQLIAAGARLDGADLRGHTVLHHAAAAGATGMLRRLLAAGAPVDAQAARDGATALMLASANGKQQAARALLAAGASVAIRDHAGQSALHHAARAGQPRLVDLLLDRGADLEARNEAGATAARLAALHRRAAVLARLEARGADMRGIATR